MSSTLELGERYPSENSRIKTDPEPLGQRFTEQRNSIDRSIEFSSPIKIKIVQVRIDQILNSFLELFIVRRVL